MTALLVCSRRKVDSVRTAVRTESGPPARVTDTGRGTLPGQEPEAPATAPGKRDGVGSRVDGRVMNSGLVCPRTTPGIIEPCQWGPTIGRAMHGDALNRHERIHSAATVLLGKPIVKGTGLSVQCLPGSTAGGRTEQRVPESDPRLRAEARAIVTFDRDHGKQAPGRRRPMSAGRLCPSQASRHPPEVCEDVSDASTGVWNRNGASPRRTEADSTEAVRAAAAVGPPVRERRRCGPAHCACG